MAKTPTRGPITWADLLVRQGVISLDQLAEAQQGSKAAGMTMEDYLVRQDYADEEAIMRAKAKQFGLPYIDLEGHEIPPEVSDLIPESVARSNHLIPLELLDDGGIRIAVADTNYFDIVEKLRFMLNRRLDVALAGHQAIADAIKRSYGARVEGGIDQMMQEFTTTGVDFQELANEAAETVDENSAPVVRLVDMIIKEAVKTRASDIHIEPFEHIVRIRYRIDGVLIERDSTPRRLLNALLSRIKILGKMDIAERRRPQDGRIKLTTGTKELDLRVSVLPTSHGQSVVMRLLDKDNIKVGVRQLGFSEEDFQVFNNIIRRPNGIILVTGPTGSGKTTTLYAALNELNRPDRKIITAEDPVEYYLPGVNQVEVKHSIGLDFARIIRAMLRQAPNVILVGEIRDRETAEMAIQASLTGHLVFSTLHTNDAPSSITRMIDIGVPPYLVASSVIAIMAQRLVRVICKECAEPFRPSDAVLQQAGIPPKVADRANFMKGAGCSACGKKGYRGRLAIFELMPVNAKVRELAFKGVSSQELRKVAVAQGMKSLYKDGIIKAIKGVTTLEEVFRVAGKK